MLQIILLRRYIAGSKSNMVAACNELRQERINLPTSPPEEPARPVDVDELWSAGGGGGGGDLLNLGEARLEGRALGQPTRLQADEDLDVQPAGWMGGGGPAETLCHKGPLSTKHTRSEAEVWHS